MNGWGEDDYKMVNEVFSGQAPEILDNRSALHHPFFKMYAIYDDVKLVTVRLLPDETYCVYGSKATAVPGVRPTPIALKPEHVQRFIRVYQIQDDDVRVELMKLLT